MEETLPEGSFPGQVGSVLCRTTSQCCVQGGEAASYLRNRDLGLECLTRWLSRSLSPGTAQLSLHTRCWACGLLLLSSVIPSVRTAPDGCGQKGASSVGSVTSLVSTFGTTRSLLHVRKMERVPRSCTPLAAPDAAQLRLVRQSPTRSAPSPSCWCEAPT